MKVVCCECKKVLREEEGGDGISHTWCKRCVVKVKKEIWEVIHYSGVERHYHPWATDDGKFFIYKSEPYRGGVIWEKKIICESLMQMEDLCKELNGPTKAR